MQTKDRLIVSAMTWLFDKAKKRKGGVTKANKVQCFRVFNDMSGDDIEREESSLLEIVDAPPQLLIYMKKNIFHSSKIVADQCVIETQADSLPLAFLVLVCSYYVFNLEFASDHAPFLSFLQFNMTKDPSACQKYGKGYHDVKGRFDEQQTKMSSFSGAGKQN